MKMSQILMDIPWVREQDGNTASPPDPSITLGLPTTLNKRRYRHALQRHALPDLKLALIADKAQGIPIPAPLIRPLPAWKRIVDLVGAVAGLVFLSPLMLAVAIAIKLTSRGPVIFKQTRTGHGGEHFTMYKFRTMILGAENHKQELQALN